MGKMKFGAILLLVSFMVHSLIGQGQESRGLGPEAAGRLAKLALNCISREYPNKPDHVINDGSEVLSPQAMHPAFYGCFDWHSSVHGHWMLVRLLKTVPGLPGGIEIRRALGRNLLKENIRREIEYLGQPNRKSFERTYGWAWLLKLQEELDSWNDPEGRIWADNLRPLADSLVGRFLEFLPKQNYPIRTGVHPNTAFGLAFAYDYCQSGGARNGVSGDGYRVSGAMAELKELVAERAQYYYRGDRDAPAAWEPGGEDFFSPVLMEADLMRRILKPADFAIWLKKFLPGLVNGSYPGLLSPAIVTDRSDPKLVHLDGLNLSRAWCLTGIASALPAEDPLKKILMESANRHAVAGLANITTGNYEGEHWLASFAVYLLSN